MSRKQDARLLQSADAVKAAIRRAEAYAAENKVPLTVERLAAEMQVPVTQLRAYLDPAYRPSAKTREAVEAIRQAAGQATASVVEYAMTRGSSPNMHMMYLKQYAGYGDGDTQPVAEPVIFEGENNL